MAAVPVYFYLGDRQINGSGAGPGMAAQPGLTGTYWTAYANRPLIMQTVPTTGSAFNPWWDGQAGPALTTNAATSTTVTVTPNPGWATNEHAGRFVTVDSGVGVPVNGVSQRRQVVSNTSDTLTVASAWLTNPTASTIHLNLGQWVKYDHIRGADIVFLKPNFGTEGDNWYANQGGSFGATAMLMQLLKQRHASAPYFRVFKRAYSVSGMAAWASGSAWTSFQAEWAAAASQFGSDTPDPQALILDACFTDIDTLNGAYLTHLIQVVAQMRAFLGKPNLPVFLVNPAAGILQQTKTITIGSQVVPFARVIRGANSQARSVVSNLRLVDMEGSEFAAADAIANFSGTIPTNPTDYSTDSHLLLGQKVFNAIERFYAPGPSLPAGGGVPTFVMLGDSQARGFSSPNYAILGSEASLLGENTLANLMGSQLIWDGQNDQVVAYDLTSNSNTLGDVTAQYYGPDATFLRALGKEFPDGVVLLKVASGGASMAVEALASGALGTFDPVANTLWATLSSAWSKLRLACVRDLGLTPDAQGVAVLLGDNDCRQASDAAAFATKLSGFVASLRQLLGTRTTGGDLAVAWHLPPKHKDLGGQSVLGLASAREQVRDALLAYADQDLAFGVADDEGLELRRDDGIHYSGEGNHLIGTRLAEVLLDISGPDVASAPLVVPPAPAADSAAAIAADDEIAQFSTPELQVTKRTVEEMMRLERWRAGRRMPRRTKVRFDR